MEETPCVEAISQAHALSSMQLNRDFISATGYSVSEYIRRLRLSNALCMIKFSHYPTADIAYACGYSSQQALCREIRALLQTTATAYRDGDDIYFLAPPSADAPYPVEVSRVSIPRALCLRYYSSSLRRLEERQSAYFCGTTLASRAGSSAGTGSSGKPGCATRYTRKPLDKHQISMDSRPQASALLTTSFAHGPGRPMMRKRSAPLGIISTASGSPAACSNIPV